MRTAFDVAEKKLKDAKKDYMNLKPVERTKKVGDRLELPMDAISRTYNKKYEEAYKELAATLQKIASDLPK